MRKFALFIIPAALMAAPLAFAVPPQPTTPMPLPSTSAKASVDSAMLHKFASAYEDVRQVRGAYVVKFKAANSATKKTAIKTEATQAIKQRIKKYMPLSEYIKVAKAIRTNPDLRSRLIAILKADQKMVPPGAKHGG